MSCLLTKEVQIHLKVDLKRLSPVRSAEGHYTSTVVIFIPQMISGCPQRDGQKIPDRSIGNFDVFYFFHNSVDSLNSSLIGVSYPSI